VFVVLVAVLENTDLWPFSTMSMLSVLGVRAPAMYTRFLLYPWGGRPSSEGVFFYRLRR
jgi:hypothetical protein